MATITAAKPVSNSHTLSVAADTQPTPIVIAVGHANVLTVGAGMEFATLGDALKAAPAGATIAVQAGTYTNDFGTVSQNVSIVAVGGLVHEVATEAPPDDKGILTVDANLSITGFTFTGGSDGSPDGNVAGIRLQSGNLSVDYCEFSGMQEGLLANPDPTASVVINHSFFLDNGTGDGLSHNLYVGAVQNLLVENSLFEAANVGHEIKSRAANTLIRDNVIVDGPTGTASYDIDLPNGGVAEVIDNIIEKGPEASNEVAIHYGGETQYAYDQNSLDVANNTIINNLPASVQSWAVDNQSAVNGLNVVAQIHGNVLWDYAGQYVALGAANAYANTTPATAPVYTTASPLSGLPLIVLGQGTEILHLTNSSHTVTGGVSQLVVCDTAGSNTISGGTGGLVVSVNAGWDSITTAAGATDIINLPGRNSVLMSYGTDHINATGAYEQIDAFGHATINATGFSAYELNGTGDVLNVANGAYVTVGSAARAMINDSYGDTELTMQGGTLVATDSTGAKGGLPNSVATISGALAGTIANSGTIVLATGATGASITAGAGAVSVTGGTGNDTLIAAGGTDQFVLGSGTDSVVMAGGNASMTAGSGADSFVVNAGGGGTYTITGFKVGVDSLSFANFSGNAVASGSVVNGNTILTLADGSTVDVAGVALPNYPVTSGNSGGGTGGGSGGGSGNGTGGGAGGASAGGTLLTHGNVVTGGAALLTLVDAGGGNTITGGSGGMAVTTAYSDVLSTASGSADTINLSCYDTLTGAGADQVNATGVHNQISESAAASVTLHGAANFVQGGAGLLTVADSLGGNTIIGGAGGLNLALPGTYDVVTTAAAVANNVSVGGYSQVLSQGNDQIALGGVNNMVTVTGVAAMTASGWANFVLNGNETLSDSAGFLATVGSGAANIVSSGSGGQATVAATASLTLSQVFGSGSLASVTVTGGNAIASAQNGYYAGVTVNGGSGTRVATGGGPVMVNSLGGQGTAGVSLSAGSGNLTLNGGAGNDSFQAGSGQAQVNLGGGIDTVTFGTGATTVNAGGADLFVVTANASGTAVIQNWTSGDSIGGVSPVSESVSGGSMVLSYTGGLQITLVGVSQYP